MTISGRRGRTLASSCLAGFDQVLLGKHAELLFKQRFLGQVDIVHHERDGRPAVRPNDQWVSLNDIDLSLQQCRADFQQWL